ncbi:MAG: UDP-N-acetylmuramoyl-L-alanine--D-glutamate ligase, partial [Planctomycetes bacterium]|nr:UDP-N-acetylmuramoyl-L-alanine--D-glutamate ligase [Planctomycetota bacterium]
ALTAHLLKNTIYENVWLSGNIGNQPLLTVIEKIAPDDLVVLELSSFQLEQLAEIQKAPNVALLTNLTPNHLDRHGTFANYCAAKENIFKFQKLNDNYPAVSIFNAEDKIAAEWFEKYNKDAGRICFRFSTDDVSKELRDSFTLPGRANLSNLAAAIAIAKYFGIDDDRIKNSLPDFKPLPHRLELIGQINGVSWYNDSIATTPQSAIAALEAFDQPKIIIAGGYDKDLPFDELGQKIATNVKAAILIGQTASKIASEIQLFPEASAKIQIVNSLSEAVRSAARLAESGDIVLLSPACASYDMFDNFQHRGEQFCKLVRALNI